METLKKLVKYRLKQDEVKKELKLIRQEIYQTQSQQEEAKSQAGTIFSDKFYTQKMNRLLVDLKTKSEEGQDLYFTLKKYQNSTTVKTLKHIDKHGIYYVLGIILALGLFMLPL